MLRARVRKTADASEDVNWARYLHGGRDAD